tara:strand:+ start:1307 stop:2146 length:840 start_codon:yes stop_codon:yes gene_type:complete
MIETDLSGKDTFVDFNKINDDNKNKWIYDLLEMGGILKKSFTINKYFWVVMIISTVILSIKYGHGGNTFIKITTGCLSFILASLLGYFVHYISHKVDYTKLYTEFKEYYTLHDKLPLYLDKLIHIFTYIIDFHDKQHHDSNINTKWYNILIEGIENILMEGGLLVILAKLLGFGIHTRWGNIILNYPIIILWGLLYTTVHLVNYKIVDNPHKNHHKNYTTNYGIDSLDIIFNTKYDINNIENMNHAGFNIIIILVLIILIKDSKFTNIFIRGLKYLLQH